MAKEVIRHDEIQGDILHEYDGIEEADNRLPNWWLAIFYGSMVFAVFYWFYYHEYEIGPLPMAAYMEALESQSGEGSDINEAVLFALMDDPTAVAEGQSTFVSTCAACHEANGGGKIGPNLTDAYWIHGGTPKEIFASVYDGVLEKGMPAWGASLGGPAVQKTVAYVLTIRDTEVAGGKEPQGDLYDPDGAGEGESADEAVAVADGEGTAEDVASADEATERVEGAVDDEPGATTAAAE